MAKTNKELAVELYSAFLISSGNAFTNPNLQNKIKLVTNDEMIKQIQELTVKLSSVQDN